MARVAGLDVGDKTIGVAVSDALGMTAQPVTTVRRAGWDKDLAALKSIFDEREVSLVVVGLPLNMDGSEGPRAALSRRFADKVHERFGLPVELWDERLTTAEVNRVLIAGDASRKKRKEVVDTLAAQVILQGFMDAHANRKAREQEP